MNTQLPLPDSTSAIISSDLSSAHCMIVRVRWLNSLVQIRTYLYVIKEEENWHLLRGLHVFDYACQREELAHTHN